MIEIKDLYAGYGKKTVLKKINTYFEKGKVTVLVGPNGCGKSTLLKTVIGLNGKDSGTILYDGISAETLSAGMLAKKVAYLPQNRRVPDISVKKMVLHGRFAHLSYPRKYRPEDIEIAEQAIRWAGLEGKEEELVSRLSGGMQQNVYIAMAMAQNADTILMDEPTTYLDAEHQFCLMDQAQKLAKEGKAVVMVLHDLSLALKTADRIIVMSEGRIVKSGTADEMFDSGILSQVFHVEMEKIRTKRGLCYVCFPKSNISL